MVCLKFSDGKSVVKIRFREQINLYFKFPLIMLCGYFYDLGFYFHQCSSEDISEPKLDISINKTLDKKTTVFPQPVIYIISYTQDLQLTIRS